MPHRAYSQYQARIHVERSQQAASLSFFNLKRLNWTFSRNPRQLLNEVLFVGLDFGKREQKAPESATKIICKDKLFYLANHTGGWMVPQFRYSKPKGADGYKGETKMKEKEDLPRKWRHKLRPSPLRDAYVSALRTAETSADSFPRIAYARKKLVYLYGTFNVVKLNAF